MIFWALGCLVNTDTYEERHVLLEDADQDGVNILDGDCDDRNNTIYPGAVEVCDDLDNDCDDLIDDEDEVDAETWYLDTDGDGFGADAVVSCTKPENAVVTGGDCEDTDSQINPTETEICGDGLDNDCSGDAEACRYQGDVEIASMSVAEVYGSAGDRLGIYPSPGIDSDGDGFLEAVFSRGTSADQLICGVEFDSAADGSCRFIINNIDSQFTTIATTVEDVSALGESGVLLMSSDGAYFLYGPLSGTLDLEVSTDILMPSLGDISSATASSISDPNGDGLSDFGFPITFWDGTAGVYLLSVGDSGEVPLEDSAYATIVPDDVSNALVSAGVAGPGDIDGDGVHDVLVGNPLNDGGGDNAGAVHVFHGPVSGLLSYSDADVTLYGDGAQDYTGILIASAGDTNGDGYPEILVSAPFRDVKKTAAGSIYLMQGSVDSDGVLTESSILLTGDGNLDYSAIIPTSNRGGDVDGDGFDDIVIGAISDGYAVDNGVIHLIYGPVEANLSVSESDAHLQGITGSQASFANIIGDTNGDGFDDILIGAPYDSTNGEDAGAVYLILGGGM